MKNVSAVIEPINTDAAHMKARLSAFKGLFDTPESLLQDPTFTLEPIAALISQNVPGESVRLGMLRRVACAHLYRKAATPSNAPPVPVICRLDIYHIKVFLSFLFNDAQIPDEIEGYEECALPFISEAIKPFDPRLLSLDSLDRWSWKTFRKFLDFDYLVDWAIKLLQSHDDTNKAQCNRLSEYIMKYAPDHFKTMYAHQVIIIFANALVSILESGDMSTGSIGAALYHVINLGSKIVISILQTNTNPLPVLIDNSDYVKARYFVLELFVMPSDSLEQVQVATVPFDPHPWIVEHFEILLRITNFHKLSADIQLVRARLFHKVLDWIYYSRADKLAIHLWDLECYSLTRVLLLVPGTSLRTFLPQSVFSSMPFCSPRVLTVMLDQLNTEFAYPKSDLCHEIVHHWKEARKIRHMLPSQPCGASLSMKLPIFPKALSSTWNGTEVIILLRSMMLFYQGIPLEYLANFKGQRDEDPENTEIIGFGSIMHELFCQLTKAGVPTSRITLA